MLLKECYDAFGGSYESVRQRIPRDETIEKFVMKFLSEPSFNNLCKSFENEQYDEAFRAAHSLKGVSINLSFDRLFESASNMTEFLRDSESREIDKEEGKKLLECVTRDYNEVLEAVKKYAES